MTEGARRPTARTGGVFAVPEFRVLWIAGLLSIAGDQLARVAMSVLVYQQTGSAALTAVTYALTLLPTLVSGVTMAWLADRFPHRAVMVTGDLLRAALIGAMALPDMPLLIMGALLVAAQLVEPIFASAQGATLRNVLPDPDLVDDAMRVQMITHQTALLAGFAVGGMLTAGIGPHAALALDAATFAVSGLVLWLGLRPRPAPAPADRPPTARAHILAGIRLVAADRRLRILMGFGCLAGFTVAPEGLAAPFAGEIGAGPAAVGWLLAMEPAATVLGGWLLGRLAADRRRSLLGVLAVGTAAPMLGYYTDPGLGLALVLVAFSGLCSAYQATAGAAFIASVPVGQVGQALGLARSSMITAQGLGVMGAGLLADALGSASRAIATAGAAGTLAALTAALAWWRVVPRRPTHQSIDPSSSC